MRRPHIAFPPVFGRVFPWPLVPLDRALPATVASLWLLIGLLASRLLLLASGPWEQDEALLACGVVHFDPAQHMPLPPGFPLWIYLGRLVRLAGVVDPLVALQLASVALSVAGVWALVGLWEGLVGRWTALAGAVLAAFLPGVWFHAPRGFSETPSAAFAIVALACWVRGGREGFLPGVAAMTCAALVRPPLAPFFLLCVLLAAWRVRRDARTVLSGAAVGLAILAVVMAPALMEAGGPGGVWSATAAHADEHLWLLGNEGWDLADLGLVRGLGGPAAAAAFMLAVLIGWFSLRRRLGRGWWAGSLAGAWLAYLLLFLHCRTYPRYWVLFWLLLATPALAGLYAIVRSRATAAALGLAAAAAGAVWAWPAMVYVHTHEIPVVEALRDVASEHLETGPVLVYDDDLFSFYNLAERQRWLDTHALRTSELDKPGVVLGGLPIWFLTQGPGLDVDCMASRVTGISCPSRRVERLSQERFLAVRLVRDPVLGVRGAADPETEGTERFTWFGRNSLLLLPPVHGDGSVSLALDVNASAGAPALEARVAGQVTARLGLKPGRQVVEIPIPRLPREIRLNRMVPLELDVHGAAPLSGAAQRLALRIFRVSLEAPPYAPPAFAFFPEAESLFAVVARGEGTYGPELLAEPPRPAAWCGKHAAFELPVAAGMVGVELLAPRPAPAVVDVRLGDASAHLTVGARPINVELPVPPALADGGRARLEIASSTYSPGGRDARELGVVVSRIWFAPAGP